ncbi:peptidoglycan hydrolase CwlO-like protein [Pseudomonas nitritireducens]|uniref:Peptidoglycan hydrolase CwlO-like protein n=1 Tax=Pseudomonas nitroreducens TaxID=46680 RepID=A0A7W7KJ80_PSENT|nr:hypothetical protein [Pseudomonas nitritireducens]MBB4863490.1 peptidoglycan hydrolase CwlO-like protein [Pseudomonas nitritireducens]
MAWPRIKKTSTRDLLRAEHRPHVPRGSAWLSRSMAVLVVLGLLVLAGIWMLRSQSDTQVREQAQELVALHAQIAQLTADLEEKRLQVEEDHANGEQLMRRIDAMSAEIKKLKTELAFFRQQKPGK